jgi:hypothetical protein
MTAGVSDGAVHGVQKQESAIDFDGKQYLLMTPQLTGIARLELGAAIGNIADQLSEIISALNLLITGEQTGVRSRAQPGGTRGIEV